ncbi:MAG: hypothetical protein H6599_02770 [Flavobacteriales bacterium]|nr:hypothetical protein [Flavobacteriales bacterium]
MSLNLIKKILTVKFGGRNLKKDGQFIFSVNTGRSGSDYLGSILSTADEVLAFHERKPFMIGDYLLDVEEFPLEKSFNRREVKTNQILKDLEHSGKKVYAETNHMFGKTFYDVVFKNLSNVVVIHLNRDVKDTAKSFLKLRYFTTENNIWDKWMIKPNSKESFLKFPDLENEYELIFAYIAEMRYRSEYIKKTFNGKHISINLDQLNDIEFVEKLFLDLSLTFNENTRNVVGKKINARHDRKKDFNFEFSQEKFDFAFDKINKVYKLS